MDRSLHKGAQWWVKFCFFIHFLTNNNQSQTLKNTQITSTVKQMISLSQTSLSLKHVGVILNVDFLKFLPSTSRNYLRTHMVWRNIAWTYALLFLICFHTVLNKVLYQITSLNVLTFEYLPLWDNKQPCLTHTTCTGHTGTSLRSN